MACRRLWAEVPSGTLSILSGGQCQPDMSHRPDSPSTRVGRVVSVLGDHRLQGPLTQVLPVYQGLSSQCPRWLRDKTTGRKWGLGISACHPGIKPAEAGGCLQV